MTFEHEDLPTLEETSEEVEAVTPHVEGVPDWFVEGLRRRGYPVDALGGGWIREAWELAQQLDDDPEDVEPAVAPHVRLPSIRHVYRALGRGKTREALKEAARNIWEDVDAERDTKYAILAPTSVLARQIAADLAEELRSAGEGRDHDLVESVVGQLLAYEGWTAAEEIGGEKQLLCKFPSEMAQMLDLGLSGGLLCEKRRAGHEPVRCVHFDSCPVAKAHFWSADQPRVVVGVHDYLRLGFGKTKNWSFDRVIVDEEFTRALLQPVDVALETLGDALGRAVTAEDRSGGGEEQESLSGAQAAARALAQRSTSRSRSLGDVGTEEERSASEEIAKVMRAKAEAVRAKEEELRSRFRPVWLKLCSAFEKEARGRRSRRLRAGALPPAEDVEAMLDLVRSRQQRAARAVPREFGPNPEGPLRLGSGVSDKASLGKAVEFLQAMVCSMRAGRDAVGCLVGVRVEEKGNDLRLKGHYRMPIHPDFQQAEFTVLSSTLEGEVLLPWFEAVERVGEWEDVENDPVERVQVLAGTTTRSLVRKGDDEEKLALNDTGRGIVEDIDAILRHAAVVAPGQRVLVAGVKKVFRPMKDALAEMRKDGRPRAEVVWSTFDGLLGRNDLRDCYAYVSMGRVLQSYGGTSTLLEALVGAEVDAPPSFSGRPGWWPHEEVTCKTRCGREYVCEMPTHPDPTVAAFLRQTSIGGVVQSDRSRAPTREEPALRVVYCNLPLPERFDRVETRTGNVLGGPIELMARHGIAVAPDKPTCAWAFLGWALGESHNAIRKAEEHQTETRDEPVDARMRRAADGLVNPERVKVRIERDGKRAVTQDVLVQLPPGVSGRDAALARIEEVAGPRSVGGLQGEGGRSGVC